MYNSFGNKLVDEGYEVKLFAPALDIEQIEVHAYSSKLTIFIPETEILQEYKAERLFTEIFDVPNTKASLDRGVLTVLVPYFVDKAPKRVEIIDQKKLIDKP